MASRLVQPPSLKFQFSRQNSPAKRARRKPPPDDKCSFPPRVWRGRCRDLATNLEIGLGDVRWNDRLAAPKLPLLHIQRSAQAGNLQARSALKFFHVVTLFGVQKGPTSIGMRYMNSRRMC